MHKQTSIIAAVSLLIGSVLFSAFASAQYTSPFDSNSLNTTSNTNASANTNIGTNTNANTNTAISQPAVAVPNPIIISASDAETAGFAGVTSVANPDTGRFSSRLAYFRVTQSTMAAEQISAWGESANLLVVLVRPMLVPVSDTLFGQQTTVNLQGKTQIRVFTSGYYISVTGPDANSVASLATNLQAKY